MRYAKQSTVTLALTLTATLALTTPPIAVPAKAVSKQACAEELKLNTPTPAEAAAETPVVLVHGLWSDAESLRKSGLGDAIAQINNVAVVEPFDYSDANARWVTEGDSAQRLARTIVCYSKLYDDKKVVIVAHSMGGLMAREALSRAAYGVKAKDFVGHIVTIGTPHTGANIASISYFTDMSLCRATSPWWDDDAKDTCRKIEAGKAVAAMHSGSDELAQLPRFPTGISVKAIAGRVSQQVCAPWGCSAKFSQGSDLVVPVTSATAEYTTTGVGDGKKVFNCTDPIAIPNVSHPWCEHSEMLKAPQVQAEVRSSIQAYLSSQHVEPSGTPYTFFDTMTLHLGSGMRAQPLHGEGASSYDVACTDRSACPELSVFNAAEVGGDLGWKGWNLPQCGVSQSGDTWLTIGERVATKGTRQVGGKTVTYYEAELCAKSEPRRTARFWEIPGGMFIMETSGDSRWVAQVDTLLANATWK